MASRTGRAERASEPVGESSPEVSRPDPEVPDRAKRRYFSAQYKLRVLEEADACRAPGEVGALLRREGLYSSQLTAWRRARREGSLQALATPRGPQGRRRDPVASENERLRKENAHLRRRLEQAQMILEIQKKTMLARPCTTCGGRNSSP